MSSFLPQPRPPAPSDVKPKPTDVSPPTWASNLAAALFWFGFGLDVIPIRPGIKATAVKWDPWLTGLSRTKIISYWRRHPDHEVGFIVGEHCLVFDADGPASLSTLETVEKRFNLHPTLKVRTPRGQHHFFGRPEGVFARSDSHCTAAHPDRIDVKTGQALVVLPPSGGRAIIAPDGVITQQPHLDGLSKVDQTFVDEVFAHNGRPPPRPLNRNVVAEPPGPTTAKIRLHRAILARLDPDCGYNDWFAVGAALHHETAGGLDGYAAFDDWSSRGRKYKGAAETRQKWQSLDPNHANPPTIATLRWMLERAGHDWAAVCLEAEGDVFGIVIGEGAQ